MLDSSDTVDMTYDCLQCSHQTTSLFQLDHHVLRNHKHVYAAELFHAIVEPQQFACSCCDYKSYHQFDLYEHCKQAHNPKTETNENGWFCEESARYKCDCCRFASNSSLSFTKHIDFCEKVPQDSTEEAEDTDESSDFNLTDEEGCGNIEGDPSATAVEKQMRPSRLSSTVTSATEKLPSKLHCCFFCGKMRNDMRSHLFLQHGEEPNVKDILSMPKNSAQRNCALAILRNKGDHKYNSQAQSKAGSAFSSDVIVARRRKGDGDEVNLQKFVTCPKCLRVFSKSNFAAHHVKCTHRVPNYQRVTSQAVLESRLREIGYNETYLVEHLLSDMKGDEILKTVRSDFCLQKLAEYYAQQLHKRSHAGDLKNSRQHLRRLARLLLAVKKIDPNITDYANAMDPRNYKQLMDGIGQICHFDTKNQTFLKPSLAKTYGSAITRLAKCLIAHFRNTDPGSHHMKRVVEFLGMHQNDFKQYVAKCSASQLKLKELVPTPRDVEIFSKYIRCTIEKSYDSLVIGFTRRNWLTLGKGLMTEIILFNRRRIGEVAKMRLDLYHQREPVAEQDLKSLTLLEQARAKDLARVKVPAKNGRHLVVLINKKQIRELDVHIRFRAEAQVPVDNNYLFGIPGKSEFLEPSSAMKKIAEKCGAAYPITMRGTPLRRQIATLAQMLVMNDDDIHQLASYMGRNFDVRMGNYRQELVSLQVAKMAAFLMKIGVDYDDAQRYKGKTLEELADEIDVDPETGFVPCRNVDAEHSTAHAHPLVDFGHSGEHTNDDAFGSHCDNVQIADKSCATVDSLNNNFDPDRRHSPGIKLSSEVTADPFVSLVRLDSSIVKDPPANVVEKQKTTSNETRSLAVICSSQTDGARKSPSQHSRPSSTVTSRKMPLKLHCCFFCGKMCNDMRAHIFRMHSEEPDVKHILSMPKNSEQRHCALASLRNKGDHKYNLQAQSKAGPAKEGPASSSDLIVARRYTSDGDKVNVKKLVTCPKCLRVFSKSSFAAHHIRCTHRLPNYQRMTGQGDDVPAASGTGRISKRSTRVRIPNPKYSNT